MGIFDHGKIQVFRRGLYVLRHMLYDLGQIDNAELAEWDLVTEQAGWAAAFSKLWLRFLSIDGHHN